MKIAVCIKQVPAKDAPLRIADGAKWIRETDIGFEMNEPDSFALEEALRLKEKQGGEVVAVSMGPERAKQVIKEALAKGADRGIHVTDDKFFLLDPLGTAKSLAAVMQKEAFELILTGLQSDDHGFGQTGVLLAELLGLPHATLIMQIEVTEGRMKLKRELEAGWFQWVELPLPAVLTIQSGINKVRYASLKGIMAAKKKEIATIPRESLGIAHEATEQVERIYVPQKTKKTEFITGTPQEAAAKLIEKLRHEARVLSRQMNILVITEQREGKWNPASFETLAAAQQIAGETQSRVAALVIGKGVSALAQELAAHMVEEVLLVEHDLLEKYTPDGFTLALSQAVAQTKPDLILLPHTYQVRDFAPKLAASLGKGMIGDCVGYRYENGRLIFVRQMFQGKTAADVTFSGAAPWFASFQAGASRGDQVARGDSPAPVKNIAVELKPEQIRTKPLELFREAKQAVDLAQAPILVAVGRGIKAPENIPMAEKLAKLLGGELAGSRPVCDEGWLPMDRQIGSSGQTVAPKLYLALGISGAIQHVVGMKGSRTIVAINKDQNAPIFEVADYGIVGDIFELIPALSQELEKK